MTNLNLSQQAPPSSSNGVTYKWIVGVLIGVGLAIMSVVFASTEPSSVVAVKERVTALETASKGRDKKLDEIQADLKDLEKKIDDRTSEILRRLSRQDSRQDSRHTDSRRD